MKEVQLLVLLLVTSYSTHADGKMQIAELVTFLLANCQVSKVVFLSDNADGSGSYLVDLKRELLTTITTSSQNVLFTHYDGIDVASIADIYDVIHRHSTQQAGTPTAFFVLTSRAGEVISIAEKYFNEEGRSKGSILLHSFKWLIINMPQTYRKDIDEHILNSSFDNIAVLHLDNALNGSSAIYNANTLMWRSNNTRELDTVCLPGLIEKSSGCQLFPNIGSKLNARRLEIVTRTHGGFFVMIRNNSITGIPEYHGFLIDLLDHLAFDINFTYSISPEPHRDDQMSWDKFRLVLSSGEFDLGLALFSTTWNSLVNITITQHVVSESLTGISLRENVDGEMHFTFVCPFNPFVLLLLLGSYIVTTLMYVFIVGIVYTHEHSENLRTLTQSDTKGKENNIMGTLLKRALPFHLRRRAWTILAAVVNQAYLPHPIQMSARLLLFVWSLSIVMFYALYTGSLTAAMVAQNDNHPFESFPEMVMEGDYKWGTIEESYPDTMLKSAEKGLLKTLYQHRHNYPAEDMNDYDVLMDKVKCLDSGYVLIHSQTMLRQIQSKQERPDDYFIIKEPLVICNHGLGVPKGSELGQLLSEHIHILQDTGIIALLHDAYMGKPFEERLGTRKERRSVRFNDFKAPICIAGALIAVSILVLLWEKMSTLRERKKPF